MKIYEEKIYAIVKHYLSEELTFCKFPVQIDRDPSESELKEYHEYAPSLCGQYASCLCYLSPDRKLLSYEIDIRKKAIAFNESLRTVKNENDVVAYSHRMGGWQTIGWQYNEDIRFLVDTNFGYGSASYMSVRFFYKDLQLAPYANYIRYRYADYSDIIRYTYEYNLDYSEWEYLLKDTLTFYNAVTRNKEHEVFNWMRSHLSNLISGLNNLKNEVSSFKIFSYRRGVENIVSGDDLVLLKTEKIIGSYDFIENIQILPTEVNPLYYISTIKTILIQFKPQLQNYSLKYKKEQENLETRINKISLIPDIKIYDRITESHGKIYSYLTKSQKIAKIRIYLRIRNFIAPSITIKEIKKRYNLITEKIEIREKLKFRKYEVIEISKKLNEALAKMERMEI